MKTDLTKIKNKSLAGADLEFTSFFLANLSGVNLSDTVLSGTNFFRTDLSGVDFTATNPRGVIFFDSDLTNSNFEGVNLSPEETYGKTFENKAYLDPKQDRTNPAILAIENLWRNFLVGCATSRTYTFYKSY